MEKKSFGIVPDKNRHLDQYNRTPVLRVPQVVADPRTLNASTIYATQNSISSFDSNNHCGGEQQVVTPVNPPSLPRNRCPPPFAPPFAFYPSPCSMQQPKPLSFHK